ncbi:hypothetical protein F0169_18315 [Pseudomonas sp. MAFF 212408]|uniref:Serine kinase/phosphatase n=1 Tax=Pseudomonas kitaguniensis TaxID=2607908 RepID=A0A5N7KNT8_9PSED|nr:hypothetical protein [Pseudomonas kitaguniensis]MPR03854.1 hypothetical protein [Pseudomonas kitaguniensis]
MEINEDAPGNLSQQDVTRGTDNETGHDPRRDQNPTTAPHHDDGAPLEEDMSDVDAADSVASEHPDN